jgi:hypothetical protein
VRGLDELAGWIASLPKGIKKAQALAMVEAVALATAEAKRNAMRVFTGAPNRPKTGRLVNSITGGVERDGDTVAGFVSVGVPYARIQELGGEIRPVRAKWLWVPLTGPKTRGALKNMTPSEFVSSPGSVYLPTNGGKIAMKKVGDMLVPLFALRAKVNLPPRPYLGPAIEVAVEKLPELIEKHLDTSTR